MLAKASATDYATQWVNAPAGPVRRTANATVTAVAASGEKATTVSLSPSFLILGIQTSVPARVRLYPSDAAAQADAARLITAEPDAKAEVIMEFATQAGWLSSTVSPNVGGAVPSGSTASLYLGNLSASTSDVTVTLTYLPLEG